MNSGLRMAGGVLGGIGAAGAIVFGLVFLVLGGIMAAIDTETGGSFGLSGAAAMVLGVAAAGASAAMFLVAGRWPGAALGVLAGGILWAFASVGFLPAGILLAVPMTVGAVLAIGASPGRAETANAPGAQVLPPPIP